MTLTTDEIGALGEVELWVEATLQQLRRVSDALTEGDFFSWSGPVLLDADVHLLVVAAEHVRKALNAAPETLGLGVLPPDLANPIAALRALFEHRDEHLKRGREGQAPRRAEMRVRALGGEPFVISWGPKGFTIAKTLSARRLAAEMENIRSRIKAVRQRTPIRNP